MRSGDTAISARTCGTTSAIAAIGWQVNMQAQAAVACAHRIACPRPRHPFLVSGRGSHSCDMRAEYLHVCGRNTIAIVGVMFECVPVHAIVCVVNVDQVNVKDGVVRPFSCHVRELLLHAMSVFM